MFFCHVDSVYTKGLKKAVVRFDESTLTNAFTVFDQAVWLANIGSEKDGLVSGHFQDQTDVLAFGSKSKNNYGPSDYKFGHFSYDLKNQLERLVSSNPSRSEPENRNYFIPEIMVDILKDGRFQFHERDQEEVFRQLINEKTKPSRTKSIDLQPTYAKEEYVEKVKRIKSHIQLGDVYELNFCMDHIAANVDIDPVEVFSWLKSGSESPFCVYYKQNNLHVICLSPERFMAKRGNRLYSQPMKGTSKREDQGLENDPKERAENIMITDLVRNDLSKSAKRGSVRVDELCGVYPFGSVNQMISTVSCELAEDLRPEQAILNAFPMGSMTGAPKVRAMELIDEFEDFKRGIYSGAIGYFAPNGDFDFNVVIRSLIYDSDTKKLSCPTGSAITIQSDPEREYDECMLKAQWIKDKLNELCS